MALSAEIVVKCFAAAYVHSTCL